MKPLYLLSGCAVPVLLLLVAFWAFKPSVALVTCDVQRIQGQLIHQLALHHATPALVQSSKAAFHQNLKRVLDAFGAREHVVIVSREAVLAGGRDVTDAIIHDLAVAMRGVA